MEAEKVRVIILTANYRINGDLRLPKEKRLTDYIGEAPQFFALTDAEVIDHHGKQILTATFLDVHRERVEVLMPDTPDNLIRFSDLHE